MPMDINEWIGQRVHFYRYNNNEPLRPRAATITGPGLKPMTFNLQVIYDFSLDVMNGGGPDSELVGDVPLLPGPPAGGGWHTACCFPPRKTPEFPKAPATTTAKPKGEPARAGQAAGAG